MHHFKTMTLGLFVVSLVGCGSDSKSAKTTGAACKTAADCGSGNLCVTNKCVTLPGNGDAGVVSSGGGSSFGGSPVDGTGGLSTGSGGVIGSGGSGPTGTGGGRAADSGPPARTDGGPVTVPGSVSSVPCGDKSCTNRDSCCGTTAAGGTQYACSSSACSGAAVVISCDGPEDCAASQKCCQSRGLGGIGGGTYSYACQAQCTGATIGCGGPANCGAGSVCCTAVTAGGASKTSCEPSTCAQGEYQICRANRDCAVGMTCTPSLAPYLPGLRYCM
jgi:hypothetical protein